MANDTSVREYVGARYVPVFANPGEWSSQTSYEPLTIVTYQGNSYTSRQYVPVGIDISNADYWAETGNYNAQVEAYRLETRKVGESLDATNQDLDDLTIRVSDIEHDGWVTSDKIADEAVTTQKIANGAVTSDKIPNGSISTQKISSSAFDDVPTEDSDNLLTSGAIYNAYGYRDTKRKIIILGDSWVNPNGGVSTAYIKAIQSANNAIVYNYGDGGALMTSKSTDTSFSVYQQALNAVADHGSEDIYAVIIIAGVNDLASDNFNETDYINCCVDIYGVIKGAWKNTKLLHLQNNAILKQGVISTFQRVFNWAMYGYSIMVALQPYLTDVLVWSLMNTYVMKEDYIHPNNNGAKIIGNLINQWLLGKEFEWEHWNNYSNGGGKPTYRKTSDNRNPIRGFVYNIPANEAVEWNSSLNDMQLESTLVTMGAYIGIRQLGETNYLCTNYGYFSISASFDNRTVKIRYIMPVSGLPSGSGTTDCNIL